MNPANNSLKPNSLTLLDKIKILLRQPYKLVLVQQHELERLRSHSGRNSHSKYVESLYKHYIIEGKGKTYLCD